MDMIQCLPLNYMRHRTENNPTFSIQQPLASTIYHEGERVGNHRYATPAMPFYTTLTHIPGPKKRYVVTNKRIQPEM